MIVNNLKIAGRVLAKEKAKRMKSGYVILAAGEEVGEHVTEQREELIVFLSGKAKVISEGKSEEIVSPATVYIESEKKHNVVNIGSKELKYVYTVAFL